MDHVRTLIPPAARRWIYAIYILAGLIVGAVTVATGGLDWTAAAERVLAYLAVPLAVLVSSGATVLIAHLSTRRRLDDLKAQQAAITEQVVNSHAGQPNLREDVDQLKADARGNAMILARLERYMDDLDVSVRALSHSLDRRDKLQTEALASAVADRKREIAKAIDTALTQHCPARTPHRRGDPPWTD